jgi:heptosyltransferase-3
MTARQPQVVGGPLLAVHPGALGDVVLAFRVLTSLKPLVGAVDLMAQGHLGRMADELGVAGRRLEVESALFATLYSRQPDRRLKAVLDDYATILVFSVADELAAAIEGCTGARVLAIRPRPAPGRCIHVQDALFRQLSQLGIDLPPAPHRRPDVPPSAPGRVLIHPGAGSARKRLPPAAYIAVARQLAAMGWQPGFVLGPSEPDLLAPLRDGGPDVPVEAVGDLGRLIRILQNTDALVGNDSGISHLAAFLGVPTLAIFGPTDPRRWAPRGWLTSVVAAPEDCAPCYESVPANCPDPVCIDALSPARIVAAFLALAQRIAI